MAKPYELINPDLILGEGQEFFSVSQPEMQPPLFTLREVAKVFFGRSRIWLYKQKDYHLPARKEGKYGKWQYQLRDIEILTYRLFEHGIINVKQCEQSLLLVKTITAIYRLGE